MSEEPDKPETKAEGMVERTIQWFEDCIVSGIRRKVNELGNMVIENALRLALTLLALVLAVTFLSLAIVTALHCMMPLPVALAVSGTIFALVGLLFWKMGTSKKK